MQSQKASLSLAQAQETNARNNLSYTVVKSPVDGTAGMISYRVGALVGPTMTTPLINVSDNSEIYAYFSMTEAQILSLARRSGSLRKAVQEMPDVQLILSDGSEYAYRGKIDAVSGVIDATTGAVSLRATFQNAEGVKATLPELRRQIREVENALSLVLGQTPGTIERKGWEPLELPVSLTVGVPLQLLSNRPDVRQAEMALA